MQICNQLMKEPKFQIWQVGDNFCTFGALQKIGDMIFFLLECRIAKLFVFLLYNGCHLCEMYTRVGQMVIQSLYSLI